MRNKRKLRLMVKLASFEQKKGKELEEARNYYRSDYISIRMIKNVILITAAFAIGLFLWGCYHLEELLEKMSTPDVWGIAAGVCVVYAICLTAGLLTTYIRAVKSYFQGQKELHRYRVMLEHLSEEMKDEWNCAAED